MVFRDVIAVEAGVVVFFHQSQPIGVEPVERGRSAIHMIEHAELHGIKSPCRPSVPPRHGPVEPRVFGLATAQYGHRSAVRDHQPWGPIMQACVDAERVEPDAQGHGRPGNSVARSASSVSGSIAQTRPAGSAASLTAWPMALQAHGLVAGRSLVRRYTRPARVGIWMPTPRSCAG